MSEQKWERSSLRHLSERLKAAGHPASPPMVGRLLRKSGYSLRVNAKKREASAAYPDRESQFEVIASQRQVFQATGSPINVTNHIFRRMENSKQYVHTTTSH